MFRVKALPALVVEAFRISAKVLVRELLRLLHIFKSENFPGKIGFQNVLQPSRFRVIEKATARTNVGVDVTSIWRILPPMRELITVGRENGIETQRLDIGSCCDKEQSLPVTTNNYCKEQLECVVGVSHLTAQLQRSRALISVASLPRDWSGAEVGIARAPPVFSDVWILKELKLFRIRRLRKCGF